MPNPNHPTPVSLAEITKHVDDRVDYRIDRAKTLLESTLGMAIKVVGGAVALVLFVLGFFGYTTWTGLGREVNIKVDELVANAKQKLESIESDSKKLASESIEATLKESNPIAAMQAKLDKAYDRAMISAWLVDKAKRATTNDFARLKLGDSDLQRVSRLLIDKDTDAILYSESLEVAASFDESDTQLSSRASVLRRVATQLRQQSLEGDAGHRLSLLFYAAEKAEVDGLEREARDCLKQKETDEELVVHATRYLGAVGDKTAVELIEGLADTKLPSVSVACVESLARLSPASSVVDNTIKAWVEKAEKKQLTLADYSFMYAVMVAAETIDPFSNEDDSVRSKRRDISGQLLNLLVTGKVEFFYDNDLFDERDSHVVMRLSTDRGRGQAVKSRAFTPARYGGAILRAVADRVAKNELADLNALLDCVCLRNDQERQKGNEKRVMAIRIKLRDGAKIVVEGGRELTGSSTEHFVAIFPTFGGNAPTILWRDELGIVDRGTVQAFACEKNAMLDIYALKKLNIDGWDWGF